MGRILVWRADLADLRDPYLESRFGRSGQVWTGLTGSGQVWTGLGRSAGISSGQLVWQDMSDLCASQIILGIIYPLEMLFRLVLCVV